MTLYIDLDGVLADFDTAACKALNTNNTYKYEFVWGSKKFWEGINRNPTFFYDIDPMPDMWDLLHPVWPLKPVILTALPITNVENVERQKRQWVRSMISDGLEVICCQTKDKPNYCKPGDILIDDRAVNREAWIAEGGTFIVHTCADRTVGTLKALGVID